MADPAEHDVIYLQPTCADCVGTEKCWCEDDDGPCDCGRPWVTYARVEAAPEPTEASDENSLT